MRSTTEGRSLIAGVLACIVLAGCQARQAEPVPEPKPAEPPSIEEFVRAVYIHGVPYDRARAYGSEVVPQLLRMLANPEYEAHWANIVVTLCIIADERAVDPILAFIARGRGRQLQRTHYKAKSSAVMALGYIIHATGNQKCLDYLRESLEPDAWEKRDLRWESPLAASRTAQDIDLSTQAVLGLALSGRPEAAQILREFREPESDAAGMRLRAAMSPIVKDALEEHAKIQRLGLSDYYREMHAHERR